MESPFGARRVNPTAPSARGGAVLDSTPAVNDPRLTFDAETHVYRLGDQRLLSVTQVLALTGIADFDGPWFSDEVKARGTAAHEAIALDVQGGLDETTLTEDQQGCVDGWRRFLADTGATVEYWEQALCDPTLGVAGRCDGIVRMRIEQRDVRLVIDVKRALYPSAAIQLAGYVDMAAALYPTPVFLQRAALVLPGDGRYTFHRFIDPLDRATWQAALRIANWRRQHYGDRD